MGLINTIVHYPAQLERRVELREEFLRLGLLEAIEVTSVFLPTFPVLTYSCFQSLRLLGDSGLNTQLDVFLEELEGDKADLSWKSLNIS